MRFQYSFQKIVDLKSNEKAQAEWVLSEAIGKLRQEENELTELHKIKEDIRNDLTYAAGSGVRASDLHVVHQYVKHLDSRIENKLSDITTAQDVVDQRQHQLTESMMQEKVWLKAKDKAYEQFSSIIRKKEQDTLDEMATTRFKRQ